MKLKYAAAISLLAWLGVVAWMATMVIAKPAVMRTRAGTTEPPVMNELRNGVARNQRAEQALAGLQAGVPAAGEGAIALSPRGRLDPETGDALRIDAADAAALTADHVVSLIVSSGARRRALIDGRYVGPGARLDGGARVRAIGFDWVAIDDERNGRRILRVRSPYLAPGEEG
ncbi:hypothetical protein H0E84_03440 [Luteimonas sp. SJ-92]|uniref:Uncharacterized protein n=1 Tax=Luteimonas salinisoli TaxID=2752307 RepID=A0A853J988_9GAMM|nr:hypothetical protein [Luteimonas salinisoli]NZA25425.1 hypothetical protein [Luteimonas salinisoli]